VSHKECDTRVDTLGPKYGHAQLLYTNVAGRSVRQNVLLKRTGPRRLGRSDKKHTTYMVHGRSSAEFFARTSLSLFPVRRSGLWTWIVKSSWLRWRTSSVARGFRRVQGLRPLPWK